MPRVSTKTNRPGRATDARRKARPPLKFSNPFTHKARKDAFDTSLKHLVEAMHANPDYARRQAMKNARRVEVR